MTRPITGPSGASWKRTPRPAQREWLDKDYTGPARVSGSAGTGKTIVALHRAVHLARANTDSRVLLATFSDTLAHALRIKLRRLIGNSPMLGERIEVHARYYFHQHDALGQGSGIPRGSRDGLRR